MIFSIRFLSNTQFTNLNIIKIVYFYTYLCEHDNFKTFIMKKITLLILLITSVVSFGQVSLDFEDGTTSTQFNFNGVGSSNAANTQMNGINTSSRVLEVTKPAGSQWFAGCGFQAASGSAYVNMADGDMFTVKIWSSKANVPFRVRLQADLNTTANTAYNYDFTVTTANQWVEYTLDFSGQVNGTEQYREIVIQPDFDPACEGGGCGDISVGGTYLIDDFVQVVPVVNPTTDATLSDLTVDGTTVEGFSSNTFSYDVELPNGTTTTPPVAGTASQAGMGSSNVSVSSSCGVPCTVTVTVTAPDGTTTQDYTVNFTEAPALPPAAPTPTVTPTLAIISDAYANINTPQVDVFGGTLINVDLNGDSNDEARLLNGGSGFQFNYFPGGAFQDVSAYDMMHVDVYVPNAADGDILRIRLIDDDPGTGNNIARVTLTAADAGQWVAVDLTIPDGTNRNDFGDIDSTADSMDPDKLALVQFNTLDLGSGLAGKDVYLSNVYFYNSSALSVDSFDITNVKTFPNPTTDILNLNTSLAVDKVEVFNVLGKKMNNIYFDNNQVNVAGLSTGIYILKIYAEGKSGVKKFIKQ